MTYNYSYNDSPMTPNVENISRLPRSVQTNPPLPPVRPPIAPVMPQTQGSPGGIFDVLRSLFGGFTGGAPQGMRGLIQPGGQRPPGVDTLGNPMGRF